MRGSQVQILPLRPAFSSLRLPTRPVMRNETRPVISAEPLCRKISHRRSRRSAYDAGACLGSGAQAELAELPMVRHLETFPHVRDPELARSPTGFGTHSRGHPGRFLTDFLFAP